MKLSLSLSLTSMAYLSQGGGVAYEAEATALFARMSVEPTAARKLLINNVFVAGKAGGWLSKLDALYVMAAHDAQAARQNWIANLFNLTAVASPSFTVDRGYQGDGSSSYLNTGHTPSTAAGKFLLNDASYGFWSLTAAAAASTAYDMGTDFTNRCDLRAYRSDTSQATVALSSAANTVSIAEASGSGLFIISRANATQISKSKNGGAPSTATLNSSALSATSFRIGAVSTTNFGARRNAAAFIGGSLSAAEQTSLYNALNAYLTAVGAV